MKNEWKKPELEVLDVDMTMANPNDGDHLDQAYPEGTPRWELTWS
ncbi:paeninodin family lasso peptide [Halalkalibacter alkaliphilus]|uniref:Paeninodin family lasso peptide n=1 Tax=Halalkalibacter alkaliphilus TaxID=2917993 RepID=A0A9X2A657_9BACI|nr:paeninodin family lasso peptide [Halalkalibacter alkaliphilus]MCL7746086.1 paeninodin family lasso peptide [Halalkalibacter alkaliphilus]